MNEERKKNQEVQSCFVHVSYGYHPDFFLMQNADKISKACYEKTALNFLSF
jgi:hypothetical protein